MDALQLCSQLFFWYFAHEPTNIRENIYRRLADINIQAAGPYDLTERYVIVVDILFECSVYFSFSLWVCRMHLQQE